mgnify:CR=1 FL=1
MGKAPCDCDHNEWCELCLPKKNNPCPSCSSHVATIAERDERIRELKDSNSRNYPKDHELYQSMGWEQNLFDRKRIVVDSDEGQATIATCNSEEIAAKICSLQALLAEKGQQVATLEEYMLKGVAFRDELQSRLALLEGERVLMIEEAQMNTVAKEQLWQKLVLTESRLALYEKVAEAAKELVERADNIDMGEWNMVDALRAALKSVEGKEGG